MCPNCHAFTPTYKGKNLKNRGKKAPISEKVLQKTKQNKTDNNSEKIQASSSKIHNKCLDCNCDISNDNLRCFDCNQKSMRLVERPPYEQLVKEIEETSYLAVARKYGVSDNAIRKWVKVYGKEPMRMYKTKTQNCPKCDAIISTRSDLCRACNVKSMKKVG